MSVEYDLRMALLNEEDKTVKEIAIESGVAYSTVIGVRCGKHHPSLYIADKLATVLGKELVLSDVDNR